MSAEAAELPARTPFGVAARVVITRLAGQMVASLPAAVSGEDIEALHDVRVASRRLRAAFRVFGACFPASDLARVSGVVGEMTRALGQVRDQDVFIEFLQSYDAQRPADRQVGWIIEREQRIREGARMQMLDSLSKTDPADLAERIAALTARARDTEEGRNTPWSRTYAGRARCAAAGRLKPLRRMAAALENESDIDGHHRMRIAAKRLRYTVEAFIPCFGDPLRSRVSDIKDLQELLGQMHDCDVWLDKLGAYLNEPGLSAGQLGALRALIDERAAFRSRTYQDAVSHWRRMEAGGFCPSLLGILKRRDKRGNEGKQMAETRKRKAQAVPAEPQTADWGVTDGQSAVAAEAAEPEPVVEAPEPADELAVALAGATDSVSSAISRICAEESCAKLAKQLAKAQGVIDDLKNHIEDLDDRGRAKAAKWLGRLSENAAVVVGDGKLSGKSAARVCDRIRTLRRKLSDRLEQ